MKDSFKNGTRDTNKVTRNFTEVGYGEGHVYEIMHFCII